MVLKRCLLWGSSALFPMGWGSLIRITDAAFFKMSVSKHMQPLSPPPAHSLSQAFDELRKDGGHHYMEKSIQGDPDFNPNPCVHIAITWEAFKTTQSHTQCPLSQSISGRSQAVFKAPLRIPITAKLGQQAAWWEGSRERPAAHHCRDLEPVSFHLGYLTCKMGCWIKCHHNFLGSFQLMCFKFSDFKINLKMKLFEAL